MAQNSNGGSVQSLDRAVNLLHELATHERGLTLTELSELTDLHKTTVHRLVSTLLEHRMVIRDAETNRYTVGLRLLEMGQAARRQVAPSAIVRRHLTALRDLSGETTHYAVPAGDQMVYVEKIESRQAVRIASEVGDHLDLYCTALGKAYLAFRPKNEIDGYLARTKLAPKTQRTLTSAGALLKALRQARTNQFVVDDCENEPEIRCVGAAVLNPWGHAVGAVSVSAPSSRQTPDRIPDAGEMVANCAHAIARDIFGESS